MLSLFWGFRLTIWNVNAESLKVLTINSVGFRLTIWNVNKEADGILLLLTSF
ncbi:hypothetical protein [Clostridioides difficile]|uniref:hypothetical protein n=1 Tax=Clostridioides difficile TaxID=1496 RepID=UPI003AB554EE